MVARIGLIGGTFDPPHIAHLVIAQETLTSLSLDEIWFVPVNTPPHKVREHLSLPSDRLEMTERAVEGNEKFCVCDVELKREGPSYTIDTIIDIKERYPAEYFFVIGGDMAEQLHKWKDIKELSRLVTFVVAERPGFYAGNCGIQNIEHIEVPQINISSTVIRERRRKGKNIRYFVPDSVRDYIEERQLYADGSESGESSS